MSLAVCGVGAYGVTVGAGAWMARRGTDMYAAVGARFLVAGLVVAAVLRVMGRPIIPVAGERLPLAVVAGTLYAIEAICYYQALRRGAPLAATGVLLSAPTLMALAEHRESKAEFISAIWIGVALAASGLIAIAFAGGRGAIDAGGFGWAFVAALAFAAYSFIAPRLITRTSAVTASAWSSLWVGIAICAVGIASGDVHSPPRPEVIVLIASGIATGVAFMALFVVLDRFDTAAVASAVFGQCIAALVGLAVIGSAFGFEMAVGSAFVILGSVVMSARSESGSGSLDHPP